MTTKLPNFSNQRPIAKARSWLIKMIAGEMLVMLNADIDAVERTDDDELILKIEDIKGGQIEGCLFRDRGKTCFVIKQRKRTTK